ncbi:hypothetical protein PpBr36_04790 [Pyricularia pennisetigena]|uniref:hypothetical protein n=1 Tax=Pyricularia pennisetigena TaxID=1578925 RepID=UPI00114FCA3A|nr:hypothetical protein PpBr36_04790 [Pyricularia pennisetigena]TLS26869.1 hypothetical protein PpBr36_04790 [Pyricularia pennisetigena]
MDEAETHAASADSIAAGHAAAALHFVGGHFGVSADSISRATSPGLTVSKNSEDNDKRYRPRTFAYQRLLPYPVEDESYRDEALAGILKNLYMSIMAEDFSPGALHWTRELQGWLNLKFEMTRELRSKLVQVYYHLALAPGLDTNTADRFTKMLVTLTRRKHYLKPVEDLVLDWRPLWKEIKALVLPSECPSHQSRRRRSQRHLLRLCLHSQIYFDPSSRREMLDEFLPYFSTSDLTNAYIVLALVTTMLPSTPSASTDELSQPSEYFPTLFHIWSLVNRSKIFDQCFIDVFSRMSRDYLGCNDVPFSEHGIFTRDQSDYIFTAILRLTEIPVGQANSPYTTLDYSSGLAVYLEKDKKKYPVPYMIARWVVHSLSPHCLGKDSSILLSLEGLMESIDTFFHPSNHGSWAQFLGQLTYYLTDIFVSRWNREQSGELNLPADRKINDELKKRFVLSLREVTFMGLFAKSSKVANYYYSTLQGLAYLQPDLILPGALQRFYPSLQGLVEVHRTTASLCGLQMITNIMARQKGFRCHLTALMALALPGIDANDLGKTQYTLNFFQSVAYSIPLVSLIKEHDDVHDTSLAMQFVQGEMDRMEQEGQDVKINYDEELTDEMEEAIVRSSTAGFGEFIIALLGKVFTLLENLPDSSHLRTGSPEDNVINTLPAALTPLFASLSPELFEIALEKLSNFVSTHVVHQARDAMAWICNALCKVNPEKTLKVFIPMLIANIRSEIDDNGAASDRSSGTDVLPRDRALVWHVSMLSMCVVHVGNEVLRYRAELLGIAQYMQEKCRGLPTIHISNFVHHLLLNLTHTYTLDNALFEPDVIAKGLGVEHWGRVTAPADLTIHWHRPSREEIEFAVELFELQAHAASKRLETLMSDESPIARSAKNKEWSDEVSRVLSRIRLVISGVSALFDPERVVSHKVNGHVPQQDDSMDTDGDTAMDEDDDPLAEAADDDELKRKYIYPAGYLLDRSSTLYEHIHQLREDIGRTLSRTHRFLIAEQEDDVPCFTALYAAYRTWITDVGIERSAHPLERLLRLYKADVGPFKVSGLRKPYPRPLLVKRADAYQLQRVKYNASYRQKGELDKQLLLDLAESCTSAYADVRRVAQGSQDSSLKVLIGGRPLVIPMLLKKLRIALDEVNHDRIKGAMYTLLFTSLLKTLMKDWRFASDFMRMYLETANVDKASIQALGSTALYSLMDFGRPLERLILKDDSIIDGIKPADDCSARIKKRHKFILERRAKVEAKKAALGLELTEMARVSHWKVATRCILFATNLSSRFDTIAPPEYIELVVKGTNDPHPGLRSGYQSAFSTLFTTIDMRAVYDHDYRKYLAEEVKDYQTIEVTVPENDPEWTDRFLKGFEDYDNIPEFYVDTDHPGWLVWGKKFLAMRSRPVPFEDYDDVEKAAREQIGKLLDKDWFKQCFEYMKQEPRDSVNDRFRMQNAILLIHLFDLMNYNVTTVKLEDIIDLVKDVYGDGSDKHQHRATSEILGALLSGSAEDPIEMRSKIWKFAAPWMLKILAEDLTPDNLSYWMTCLHVIADSKDPRKFPEFMKSIGAFRLDMSSNAAFKESSQLQLLELLINNSGWHFRHEKPILEDFLAHIDHPYKSVRESIGRVIATIYRSRYHESFPNVDTLLRENKAASSIGIRPYQPNDEFTATILEVFERLEKWRHEREPGQQTPSSYTSGSKTVLAWLDTMLSSHECTQLVQFFPDPFINQLLHMMDVKEDPELMRLAYHVYRHLPNIPLREGEDDAFIKALIKVGRSASSWHQRLRALVNMQVVYFRRLFLTAPPQRALLFDAVSNMLADAQLEVRDGACATLAGMIRCSPHVYREPIIHNLKARFEEQLSQNPMPKSRRALQASGTSSGTETPVDVQAQIRARHAAVLGLGALIEAFPYLTPPPKWMPEVLALLARNAASDPGIVGKATKTILAEFKKTRQDSWGVDQKYFTSEQLEDLEGVLWKSYFA